MNDKEKKVKVIIDDRLVNECKLVGFHPMQNDATTSITSADMIKIIELSDHQPEILDFKNLGDGGK